jgi:hypothetical protein
MHRVMAAQGALKEQSACLRQQVKLTEQEGK